MISQWTPERREQFLKTLDTCRRENKISADVILRVNTLEIEGGLLYITMESLGDEMYHRIDKAFKPKSINLETGDLEYLKTDFNIYEKHEDRSLEPITKIFLN